MFLQVVKNRYSGDLGIVPLEFDKNTLSFAQKKKKIAEEKVEKEAPSIDKESLNPEL